MLEMAEPAGDVRAIYGEWGVILTDRKESKRVIHTTRGGFGTVQI